MRRWYLQEIEFSFCGTGDCGASPARPIPPRQCTTTLPPLRRICLTFSPSPRWTQQPALRSCVMTATSTGFSVCMVPSKNIPGALKSGTGQWNHVILRLSTAFFMSSTPNIRSSSSWNEDNKEVKTHLASSSTSAHVLQTNH